MIYMLHRTMLGWDQCSPSSNHDSQGGECTDACHQMEVEGKVVTRMMMTMMIFLNQKCNGEADQWTVASGGMKLPAELEQIDVCQIGPP